MRVKMFFSGREPRNENFPSGPDIVAGGKDIG